MNLSVLSDNGARCSKRGSVMRIARLAARLRDYDWLAAAIELVIVVVGILVALQVSNWNQARIDRARGNGYNARIHADLVADANNMEVTLAYWRAVSDYGRAAIAYGEAGTLAGGSAWQTVLAFYQASQTMPFVESDSAYLEMRSAGDLGLIDDAQLRARLATYYSLAGVGGQSIIHEQDPEYRRRVRGLTPWAVQEFIWSHCFRESSYATQSFVACASPVSEQDAAAILAGYRQAPDLLNHLRAWMSQLRVSEIVLANDRRDALTLADKMRPAGQR